MNLGMKDRVRVLKKLDFCTTCAGLKHSGYSCWANWDWRKAPFFRCAFMVNPDKNHQCPKAWSTCTDHPGENDKKANDYLSKYGWTLTKNAQHEHVIMHFKHETKVQEPDYQMSVDLDPPNEIKK